MTFRFKPWHDVAALVLLAALIVLAVVMCAGCFGRETPADAAKAGAAIGSFFGPWGAPIGAAIAYVTAFAARKIERDRMLANHADQVDGLTRTISALRSTAVTVPGQKYPPADQNPLNGDGLVPHG